MPLLFDLTKKLLRFPVIIPAKFDVSYQALLVFCVLVLANQFGGGAGINVLAEPEHGRQLSLPPPFLLLGEQNYTGLQKFPVIPPGEISQRDSGVVPDYVRGSLSSLCEKCSESQRKKVEQILLLLFNFNSRGEKDGKTDGDNEPNAPVDDRNKQENFSPTSIIFQQGDGRSSDKSKYRKNTVAPLKKVKKDAATPPSHQRQHYLYKKKTLLESYKSSKFKVTSAPKSSPLIPTPEFQHYQGVGGDDYGGALQSPTLSTTPSSSSVPPAYTILPYFYPSTLASARYPTLAFPSSLISTTMSSALEPVQSVEMPTPPMPPTTTGPIYLYYLSSSEGARRRVSSSMQPPTTPVVESSVASKPTTIEP